jgi:hypothetical protein
LCTRLCHAHLRRRHIFLLRFCRAAGALRVSGRNDSAVEQILLTPRIVVQEHQLRVLRVGIVNSRVDLRGCQIAARSQLRGIQLHNHLPLVQTIAFPRKNFFHASSCARAHMRFVYFDRSRNGVPSIAATGKQ